MASNIFKQSDQRCIPYIEKNYRTINNKENRALRSLMGVANADHLGEQSRFFDYMGVFSMGIQMELEK